MPWQKRGSWDRGSWDRDRYILINEALEDRVELIHTVISFIIALGVLVTIHEYGHFWMARRCGVKVLRFSVGFGAPLLQWQDKQGTQFWISAIPLGGYVKMLDAREGEVPPELMNQEFGQKTVWQRIAVFAAGPLVNLLFAVVVYWALFMGGVSSLVPVVGDVDSNSLAGQAGFQSGDEIVRVDGKRMADWESVSYALIERIGDTGSVEIEVKDQASQAIKKRVVQLNRFLGDQSEIGSPLDAVGLVPFRPEMPAIISAVTPNRAGEQAGFQAGDRVIAVNDRWVKDWIEWVEVVRAHPEKALTVEVERDGAALVLTVVPEAVEIDGGQIIGQIGLQAKSPSYPKEMYREIHYSIGEALVEAVAKTGQLVVIILKSIVKMIEGVISLDNLSGPITIAKIAGDTASYGLDSFLNFLAYLSISLGVLNLLPIPILDGGHILYALFEVVRGKPLSERFQHWGLGMGMALLAMFMVIAFYNDIVRLIH